MTEPEVCVAAVMRDCHEARRNDLSHVLGPRAEAADLARLPPPRPCLRITRQPG